MAISYEFCNRRVLLAPIKLRSWLMVVLIEGANMT